MKKRLLLFGAVAVVIAIVSAALWQSMVGSVEVGEKGFLEGTVSIYIGIPCRVEETCERPYPNYEVIVYGADGETEVARTTSDQNGNYKIALDPGDYIIYTPSGLKGVRPNQATVVSGETTKLNLVVDTGIR